MVGTTIASMMAIESIRMVFSAAATGPCGSKMFMKDRWRTPRLKCKIPERKLGSNPVPPSDIGYQQTIDTMTRFFQAQGSSASDAAAQAVAWVGQTLQHQVDLLAHIDVFWILAMFGAVMVPVALTSRSIDLKASARSLTDHPREHVASRHECARRLRDFDLKVEKSIYLASSVRYVAVPPRITDRCGRE